MDKRSQPVEPERVGHALMARGYRLTRQRRVVYDFLAGVTSHPTAEMVYTAVKRQIPSISLATVYKALESLVASGLARKLSYGDHSSRYDACMDHHYHARCRSCGKVSDVRAPEKDAALMSRLSLPRGFRPGGVRVEVVGVCAGCAGPSPSRDD